MRTLVTALVLCLPVVTSVTLQPSAYAADKNKAPLTDDAITDQVMVRLAGDSEVKGGGIDVKVTDGAVTLKGVVDTDRARSKAEKLAKHVKGVKSVTNQLTIRE